MSRIAGRLDAYMNGCIEESGWVVEPPAGSSRHEVVEPSGHGLTDIVPLPVGLLHARSIATGREPPRGQVVREL